MNIEKMATLILDCGAKPTPFPIVSPEAAQQVADLINKRCGEGLRAMVVTIDTPGFRAGVQFSKVEAAVLERGRKR